MALKVNHPPLGLSPHVAEDAIYDGTPTGRRPQDSRVHYRGGKRIDTTQRPQYRPQDTIPTVTFAEDAEIIRRFIREEFKRYIGDPKDWRGRKGTT